MNLARWLFIGLICSLLAACGSDDLDEVRTFVRDAHSDKKPKVEPLPEIKTQEVFAYGAGNLPDPFASFNLRPSMAKSGPGGSGGGAGPDPNRRKEPLEDFPLDSLKMVGTLARGKQAWAIIQAPDGSVHRAKTGDHLGQNSGLVTKVTEEKVDLIELVQSPLGDWVEREASLTLLE
jgi:type IV pilus assembly protein PilP